MRACQATFLGGGSDSLTMLKRSLFDEYFDYTDYMDFHDDKPIIIRMDPLTISYMMRRSLFDFVVLQTL